MKPIHPADARTLRRLRALAAAELAQVGALTGLRYTQSLRVVQRVNYREGAIIRLLRAAGIAVPAAIFALAALLPAAPTPIDSSLPSSGCTEGGRATNPAPGTDAWRGFLWTT